MFIVNDKTFLRQHKMYFYITNMSYKNDYTWVVLPDINACSFEVSSLEDVTTNKRANLINDYKMYALNHSKRLTGFQKCVRLVVYSAKLNIFIPDI